MIFQTVFKKIDEKKWENIFFCTKSISRFCKVRDEACERVGALALFRGTRAWHTHCIVGATPLIAKAMRNVSDGGRQR